MIGNGSHCESVSCNHAIFTRFVFYCSLFTQRDSNKFFSASRDFLSGLVAFFRGLFAAKPRFPRRWRRRRRDRCSSCYFD